VCCVFGLRELKMVDVRRGNGFVRRSLAAKLTALSNFCPASSALSFACVFASFDVPGSDPLTFAEATAASSVAV
jgi:hypothetical protein